MIWYNKSFLKKLTRRHSNLRPRVRPGGGMAAPRLDAPVVPGSVLFFALLSASAAAAPAALTLASPITALLDSNREVGGVLVADGAVQLVS